MIISQNSALLSMTRKSIFKPIQTPAIASLQTISENITPKKTNNYLMNQLRKTDSQRMISADSALSIIDQADDGLSQAQSILAKMQKLTSSASDRTVSSSERESLNAQFQELKKELDTLADNNNLLDGSFGGVKGAEGIAAMGVDQIVSNGKLSGDAKFYINQDNGRTKITVRINGETITNTLSARDKDTTFRLQNGRSITMNFTDRADKLVAGVITNVAFQNNKTDAALDKTMSANMLDKEIVIQAGAGQKSIKMPRLFDVSSIGMGLLDADISTLSGANKYNSIVDAGVRKVTRTREEFSSVKQQISKSNNMSAQITIANINKATDSLLYSIRKNAANSMCAQTNFLSTRQSVSLLLT